MTTNIVNMPRPHDLLWGMNAEQLPPDAPAWTHAALSRHAPVVVRGWVNSFSRAVLGCAVVDGVMMTPRRSSGNGGCEIVGLAAGFHG